MFQLLEMFFFIVVLATPYYDYGMLVYTYVTFFPAIFCLKTVMFFRYVLLFRYGV